MTPMARHRLWSFLALAQQLKGLWLMYTMLMPFAITQLICFSFIVALTWDMVRGSEVFKELILGLYGHWEDPCDEPLGALQQCFWIMFWMKVFTLASWANSDEGHDLTRRLWHILRPVALTFEVAWPTVTLLSLRRSSDERCGTLRLTGWLLLASYLLPLFAAFVTIVWPRLKPVSDPADLVREFQHVQVVGVQSCSICLHDFSTNETIVRPCTSETHVFHRSCLANWLRVSQSCPLCRKELSVKKGT